MLPRLLQCQCHLCNPFLHQALLCTGVVLHACMRLPVQQHGEGCRVLTVVVCLQLEQGLYVWGQDKLLEGLQDRLEAKLARSIE